MLRFYACPNGLTTRAHAAGRDGRAVESGSCDHAREGIEVIEARRRLLGAALGEMERPVSVWSTLAADVDPDADLAQLLSLQPLLSVREFGGAAPEDPLLPSSRYPVYGMSLAEEDGPRGNRHAGFPTGFSLDAFVDELVALSRGQSLASPLARETIGRMRRPVAVRILTSPG